MLKTFVLFALIGLSTAIPIENGIEGGAEIECGSNSVTINFNTQAIFEGHIYVKGRFTEPGCRNDEGGRQVAGIILPFFDCGVERTRSLNPKGFFVTVTIVVTFHPQFMTKVDRAYKVQCFYMEADKTVSQDIEVSMITTDFRTQIVPMPVCRYEILDGGPTGSLVQYALIGQQVYHKWTCESNSVDTFCMVVHSCFVDDGNGDRVDLLNTDGCAQDRYLLNNLEYPTDLMAGQEAHVFKYADRPALFFQCQITIVVKEPNGECQRPQCSEPPRTKRSALELENTWDVQSQIINTLDISEHKASLPNRISQDFDIDYTESEDMCLSTTVFTIMLVALTSLLLSVAVATGYLLSRRRKN